MSGRIKCKKKPRRAHSKGGGMGRCVGGDVFIDCTKRAVVPASVISSWRSRLSSHAESLQYSRSYASASCFGERKGLLKCRGKPVIQRCPKQATRAVQGHLHGFRPNREQRRRCLDAYVLHFTHDEDYAKIGSVSATVAGAADRSSIIAPRCFRSPLQPR
jgi:hypothetical protein